ncbi:hypothetical protein CJ030_MR5G023512 [Morella rubra]|uniref:non-specific serine/threonine protein kinase n=1 Tax=Morella rubra TaxID=262757 RepID=A0A6A1VL77_9ROSI|nr:hypothetical protein CJ030_MR5G023512 [Morella rubra]
MLVYEYVNNGNLEQWLHGDVGPFSPLTWEIRMNIIIGTAKRLTYLYEGLEPKVVHRDIKSSNILVDKQWNPKVKGCGEASCDSLFSAQFQGYMLGILSACLLALAGVYTEFLMKKNNDSLYWQNVQLYM